MKKIKLPFFEKDYFLIFIIFIFSLIACWRLLTPKFYTSHDGEGHLIRMEEFHQALIDGQFPVRLARRINRGLSYPFFNFNYPFIYYLGELFHLMGLSFLNSFKLLLFISVFLGGLGVYFFTKLYFNKLESLISSLFYIFAPYRFLNMYVRGNIAESFGLSILPFVFLGIEKVFKNEKNGKWFLIIFLTILLLSHNITAMIGIFLGGVFLIFKFLVNYKNFQRNDFFRVFREIFGALVICVLLTSFYWLPIVFEINITRLEELSGDYKNFFPTLRELVYSPWGFGPWKEGKFPGKMSPQIGLVHQLVFLLATISFLVKFLSKKLYFLKNVTKNILTEWNFRERDWIFLFSFLTGLLFVFLTLPFSYFIWQKVFLLRYVQIPWRFVGYIVFNCSIAVGYFLNSLKPFLIKLLIFVFLLPLVLYANRNHIRVNMYIDYSSPFYFAETYDLTTTSRNEHIPKWTPLFINYKLNPDGEIFPPSGGISKRIIWKSNYHLFEIYANKDIVFRDNTSYYPGWRAKIDGEEVPIIYFQDEIGGLRINVPKGNHKIEFIFKETSYRLFADFLSLITLIITLSFWFIIRKV